MNRIFLKFFLFLFLITGQAISQKILVLEKTARFKNYMYYQGSNITLGVNEKLVYGKINAMNDSLITLNENVHVPLKEIDYINRSRYWFNFVSAAAKLFGFTYFTLTGFNRLINKQYPVLDGQTFLITGILLGGALMLDHFGQRKFKLGEKWQLKVIDLSL